MLGFFRISKEDTKILVLALVITLLVFSLLFWKYIWAAPVSLTVTVQESIDFTVPQTNMFGTIDAAAGYYTATSTLQVITNSADGYNITLYGDDTDNPPGNTTMDLDGSPSVGITDQTQWVNPSATTSAGNAVVRASLINSGLVLAFRVMSTSTAAFYSSNWWGANDVDGTAKWAGIASSTTQRKIGLRNDYSSATQLHSVQYYLDVATTQQAGDYAAPLTYTWTGTP